MNRVKVCPRRALILAAALLLVLGLLLPALPSRAAEEPKTIRVAFPTLEGMSFIGHSGKVTGYNYDYLEKNLRIHRLGNGVCALRQQ